jgi:RNA polymerase sigma factor (sigma-70 family)
MTSLIPSNGELLLRAREGDQGAWRELVRRHERALLSTARSFRLGPADAADAVQHAWCRLATHAHSVRNPEAISGWLVTTVRYECLRLLAERRREVSLAEDLDAESAEPEPDRVAVEQDARRILRGALTRLPERDARLLGLLMTSARPNYADVARVMGMAVGSVGPTRARALERLRAELGENAREMPW